MSRLFAVICCAALLSSCAYSRGVYDYFTAPAAYWSTKAIADCREAESLREYHQRCLVNHKRKLRSSHAALPEAWEQVCEHDKKAYRRGKEQCARSRDKHSQVLEQ